LGVEWKQEEKKETEEKLQCNACGVELILVYLLLSPASFVGTAGCAFGTCNANTNTNTSTSINIKIPKTKQQQSFNEQQFVARQVL